MVRFPGTAAVVQHVVMDCEFQTKPDVRLHFLKMRQVRRYFLCHPLLTYTLTELPTAVRAQCNFVLILGKMIRQLAIERNWRHILAAALSDP